MTDAQDVAVVRDGNSAGEWRVECLDADGDGGVAVTIFAGTSAEDRAIEYAAWKYDHIHNRG